jgi:hypothetical protein
VAPDDAPTRRSQVFTVRIWAEPSGDRHERRGTACDVATGAFCNFSQWPELTAFLALRTGETIGPAVAVDEIGGRR